MKSKILLFIGIVLLIAGIFIKRYTDLDVFAIILIALGAANKLAFIIRRKFERRYRPGYELLILAFGLAIFFSSDYINHPFVQEQKTIFRFIGIVLKITFIGLIIYKNREIKKTPNKQ
ncbi:MAG: hypothetical protein ACEPOW_04395 [Bacteroidales bacterium]